MKWKMCKMVMRSDVLSGFETVAPREGQEEELVRLGWMGHGLGRDGECFCEGGDDVIWRRKQGIWLVVTWDYLDSITQMEQPGFLITDPCLDTFQVSVLKDQPLLYCQSYPYFIGWLMANKHS